MVKATARVASAETSGQANYFSDLAAGGFVAAMRTSLALDDRKSSMKARNQHNSPATTAIHCKVVAFGVIPTSAEGKCFVKNSSRAAKRRNRSPAPAIPKK